MKYIIIGLGNFGRDLASILTENGNEVIGVDSNMAIVENYKEKISHTMCLDATDPLAISGLPLSDADVVIVAMGEDSGANIMVTAILKNAGVKRLISRAINPIQENVLRAIGIDDIVRPEEESAIRWANKLSLKGIIESFDISGNFSIIEAPVPEIYAGKTLNELGFRRSYNVLVLTTIKTKKEKSVFGYIKNIQESQGVASPETVLHQGDIMVLYGDKKDIEKLLSQT